MRFIPNKPVMRAPRHIASCGSRGRVSQRTTAWGSIDHQQRIVASARSQTPCRMAITSIEIAVEAINTVTRAGPASFFHAPARIVVGISGSASLYIARRQNTRTRSGGQDVASQAGSGSVQAAVGVERWLRITSTTRIGQLLLAACISGAADERTWPSVCAVHAGRGNQSGVFCQISLRTIIMCRTPTECPPAAQIYLRQPSARARSPDWY